MKNWENDSQDENNWNYHFPSVCTQTHSDTNTQMVCMKANAVMQSGVMLKRVATDTFNLLHFQDRRVSLGCVSFLSLLFLLELIESVNTS